MAKVYVMERKGIFSPNKHTSNQCKDTGHNHYEYSCKIAFDPMTKLDENDFLIDHIDVNKAIQDCLLNGSCERMHKRIMTKLQNTLTERGIVPIAIKVNIVPKYPEGLANLTYIYTRSKEDIFYLN